MTQPLRLPEFIKRPARAVRDNPKVSQLLSTIVRSVVPKSRLRERLKWRIPRIGEARAKLPTGQLLIMRCNQFEPVLNALHYDGWAGEEPETLPLWYDLAAQADTIIDVGAHVGHFSIVAALANQKAEVHAFEPLPRVADLLRQNIALNGVKVGVHQLALSHEKGQLSFFAVAGQIPSSSSLSREFVSNFDDLPWEEITVDVDTLDDLFPNLANATIMKVDTETTEPDVLAGASSLLKTAKPIIIIEVLPGHRVEERLHDVLARAGYEFTPYAMKHDGLVKFDRIVGDDRWRNFLLVPNDGPSVERLGAIIGRHAGKRRR